MEVVKLKKSDLNLEENRGIVQEGKLGY